MSSKPIWEDKNPVDRTWSNTVLRCRRNQMRGCSHSFCTNARCRLQPRLQPHFPAAGHLVLCISLLQKSLWEGSPCKLKQRCRYSSRAGQICRWNTSQGTDAPCLGQRQLWGGANSQATYGANCATVWWWLPRSVQPPPNFFFKCLDTQSTSSIILKISWTQTCQMHSRPSVKRGNEWLIQFSWPRQSQGGEEDKRTRPV